MTPTPPPASPSKGFAAFQNRGYRLHFTTYVLAMMADNIEHVISYWMAFQKFHSPALGGFAVLSHWLPFLFFALPVGSFAERHDPRRVIQLGMALFMTASIGWGVFFITGTLQMWQAMALLVLHGCAGVLWQTSSQLLLHDIVGPVLLPSAVRLNATARSLGVLVGPAVGGLFMLTVGPTVGIFLNAAFYLPLVIWMWKAPYGPKFRTGAPMVQRAVKGFGDIVQTVRDIAPHRVLVSMTLLAGLASFFIGNGYQAQMPGFAADLGHGDPGTLYSMLLAADAAGAITAGFLLEGRNLMRPGPRLAIVLAMLWATSLAGFALAHSYVLALVLLFCAGFFELSFSSMAQALVQINAPADMRGRVIGLFNMSSLGMRAFAGVTIGLFGSLVGVHWAMALSGLVLVAVLGAVLLRLRGSTVVSAAA